MKLFLDETDSFQKEAAYTSRLSEAPENWPQELSSDLFKQLPYLSDYNVNVNLDKVEPGRGYAFGYADISNKTERPEIEHKEAGLPHVRVPLVVVERGVKPFSVYVDGEHVRPLTEDRIRESLFNPATFDLSVAQPRDPSLVEPLMPPQRSGIGMGGEYKQASADPEALFFEKLSTFGYSTKPGFTEAGARLAEKALDLPKTKGEKEKKAFGHISPEQWKAMYSSEKIQKIIERTQDSKHPDVENAVYEMASKVYGFHPKTASANPSLLKAIAPTIRERDAALFVEKVASDASLQAGFRRSGIVPTLVEVFDKTKRASADDRLAVLADAIEPTVVTIQKLPGGSFLVKSAATKAFQPGQAAEGQVVAGEEVAQSIGAQQAQQMQPGQTATAVGNPVGNVEPEEPTKAKPVEQFGEYKVEDSMGNVLMGWVFPHALAWDGNFSPQDIMLFTNGAAYAFQEGIVGELVGLSSNLPNEEPRGDGCFYHTDGAEATVTMPVTVHSAVAGPDGNASFVCSDPFGNQFKVSHAEGLNEPMMVADGEYALPESWKFMHLNNQTELVGGSGGEDPQMGKSASARAEGSKAELIYNGSYHLRGECGLSKIASSYYNDMDPVHAEFMLGLLGVDGATAKMKVAEARKKGSVKLANLHTIQTLGERYKEATKTASAIMAKIPNLAHDLIKEASTLEDESTVDHILALNFINPENLSAFVNYLPDLEETSERLAEMLLSSYVGQREVPESAVERSMKGLEEVIVGLKGVAATEV